MVKYVVKFSKQAEKDKKLLKGAGLEKVTKELLDIISSDPYQTPPYYEKLKGNSNEFFSRRINIKHRLVYKVVSETNEVIVLRMWSHYEKI
jgi:toxin-antitoxin system, toxin component, Txe/YoeB family